MLITRKKFNRGGRYWWGPSIGVCRKPITKLFRIPATARVLWMSLFSTPGQMRYREPLEVRDVAGLPALSSDVIHNRNYGNYSLDEALKPFIGKTVYLQVEYE